MSILSTYALTTRNSSRILYSLKRSIATSTRVALVTGAAQGIGRSIALRLAEDGLDLAVNDISSKTSALNEVVKEIQSKGRQAVAVPADVSSEKEVEAMVSNAVASLGGLDVVRYSNFWIVSGTKKSPLIFR